MCLIKGGHRRKAAQDLQSPEVNRIVWLPLRGSLKVQGGVAAALMQGPESLVSEFVLIG